MEPVRIIADGDQELWLDFPKDYGVVLSPSQIRVDVPDFYEINSRMTIKCMEEMSQQAWEWISKGGVFRPLFEIVYPPEEYTQGLPEKIEDLLKRDYGIIHICGLIVLTFEAQHPQKGFRKKKIYFRTPEDHLHPKAQRHLMELLLVMTGNQRPEKDLLKEMEEQRLADEGEDTGGDTGGEEDDPGRGGEEGTVGGGGRKPGRPRRPRRR